METARAVVEVVVGEVLPRCLSVTIPLAMTMRMRCPTFKSGISFNSRSYARFVFTFSFPLLSDNIFFSSSSAGRIL